MDLCLFGFNAGMPAEAVAGLAGLSDEQVAHAYKDIRTKRATTAYLHARPLLIDSIDLAY